MAVVVLQPSVSCAFEGRIQAAIIWNGSVAETYLYTIGTNQMRIERGESEHPYPRNIVTLDTGEVTLLNPHNRSFVRLKNSGQTAPAPLPNSPSMLPMKPMPPMPPSDGAPGSVGMPTLPPMPPGVGPQSGTGPQAGTVMQSAPAMPPMPPMPMMPMEQPALIATNQTTNLLGYVCQRYEVKQGGEVMEIWATDKLPPFQAWLPNQPLRFGPRMVEDQWGRLLNSKKLFPLLAVLKYDNGIERMRFEVTDVKAEKVNDQDGLLFQPPPNYREIQPLPF